MNEIFEQIWARKYAFLGTFFLVFTLTYVMLLAFDFLPEPPAETVEEVVEEESMATDEDGVVEAEMDVSSSVEKDSLEGVVLLEEQQFELAILPTKITIEKLGKTVSVLNPNSRTIADLDAALLDGVVRHPDSATLNQEGNVFILGHSSYLPQVFNKNFQAFNGIQNLEWGDTIEVYSDDEVFEYRVEKVYRARAQDVTVPIAGTGKILTLATCNSFGSTDDRYIVEAKQIGQKKL